MKGTFRIAALAFVLGQMCWGARCTTVLDPLMLREYEKYVSAAEQAMAVRFESGAMWWLPPSLAKESAARLASGKPVRRNIGDESFNKRIAAGNATIIHWIGAIRIDGATADDVMSVIEDYDGYSRFYRAMIFEGYTNPADDALTGHDVVLGLQSAYRLASLFPQHYAFRVKGRMMRFDLGSDGLRSIHLRAAEIRESDSGVPGREDYLQPFHDHGIMWALNAYWRVRQIGQQVYLEFESITLARSVQAFACKIGFVPIPKSVVASAMESLPEESVTTILEGTRAECQRRAELRAGARTGQ